MEGTSKLWDRIVVGVGRGETSAVAIRDALHLASDRGATQVHVVGVIDRADGHKPDELRERMLAEETFLVAKVQEAAQSTVFPPSRLDIVFHVRLGEVAAALTQVAFDVDATLIVVGAHKSSRAMQVLRGSVAETLFGEGRYPLLVARPIDTEGLERTARPEPRRPGEPLRDDRQALLESSDRVDFALPRAHISGLL